MPRYYKVYVNTGFSGAKHSEIIKVDDGEDFPTEEELEEIAKEYMYDRIEYGYYECDEKGKIV